MKIKFFTILFLILTATAANAQSINWLKDVKEAEKIAADTGKPILYDFTASWCKPCQEMEKSFWTRADVIEATSQFVAVKVNFDNEKGLARKYYVSAIPNVVTTDPWGNGLNFSRGFGKNIEEILNRLKSVPPDFNSIKKANEQLEADKNNLSALTAIANFYNEKKFYYLGNEFSKRILKLETDAAKREVLMFNIGFNYLRSNVPDEAEDILEDFQKEFPASDQNEAVLYGLGIANIQKDKTKSAEKILVKLKSAYPQSELIPQLESEIEKAKSRRD